MGVKERADRSAYVQVSDRAIRHKECTREDKTRKEQQWEQKQ
jgi:hypothetical protein